MRSTFRAPIPNMKGKPFYMFGCKCCEAQDFRGLERDREDRRLIAAAKHGLLTNYYLHSAEDFGMQSALVQKGENIAAAISQGGAASE